MKARILLVDDEETLRFTFERFLANEGHQTTSAGGCANALALLKERVFDLIFADILLGDGTGMDILKVAGETSPTAQVIMITGHPTVETAADAVRLGAFDYLSKPVSKEALLRTTDRALRHKAALDENIRTRTNLEAIMRSVSDAIITVDRELNLLEVNGPAAQLCGIDRNAIGKALTDVTRGCDQRCGDAVRTSMQENRRVEVQRCTCGGTARIVNVIASPLLDARGEPRGSVVTVRDETRLEELERELGARKRFHAMIGKSGKMQNIYSLVDDLADVQATVLVTGESGTGKERIAEAIHVAGPRRDKPLVKVNCSALSEHLLESELFGHVKGAFTGAIRDKAGRFQVADGGTIFLDEIGDLSPQVQLKLLRVLQEKEFERVGDSVPVKVDVRIIVATNKDLRKKIRLGEFREDLFYRLKVVEVCAPPLRERKEDIPLLAEHFLALYAEKAGKQAKVLSAEAEKIFMEHHWPGNVRELEHAIEHACIVCRKPVIEACDLPPELRDVVHAPDDHGALLRALEKTDWNISKTAKMLGISRPNLYKKIREMKERGIAGAEKPE